MLSHQPNDLSALAPVPRRAPVDNPLITVIVEHAKRMQSETGGELPHVAAVAARAATAIGLELDSDRSGLIVLLRLMRSRTLQSTETNGPRWEHWRGDAQHLIPGLTLTCQGSDRPLIDGVRELLPSGSMTTVQAMQEQLCPHLPKRRAASILGATLDLLKYFGAAVEHPVIVPDRNKTGHIALWSKPSETFVKPPLDNPELVILEFIATTRGVAYDLTGAERVDPKSGFHHNCLIAARKRLEDQGIVTTRKRTLGDLREAFADPSFYSEMRENRTLLSMNVDHLTRHFISAWAATPVGESMDSAAYEFVRRLIVERASPTELLAAFVEQLPESKRTVLSRVTVQGTRVTLTTLYLPDQNSVVVAIGNGFAAYALEQPLSRKPLRAPQSYEDLESWVREILADLANQVWSTYGAELGGRLPVSFNHKEGEAGAS